LGVLKLNGKLWISSLAVARELGIDHEKLLRMTKALDSSPAFTDANLGVSEYQDSTGRNPPAYKMTRHGFIFLAMGSMEERLHP
jgi:Rha family phage regulatory protein